MVMAFKPPVPVPTPVGMVFKPPTGGGGGNVTGGTAYGVPKTGVYGGMGGGGGSVSKYRIGENTGGGGGENPWQKAMWANYNAAKGQVPYKQYWDQGVSQASRLGGRDYEGDLRRMAQEDVQRQVTAADNQLGSIGMRELALRGDVQADRSKAFSDASTRAMIESQGIKTNALETMRGMLGSATGAELDRIGQMISAAQAGGANFNQFQGLMLPIKEKLGMLEAQKDFERRNPSSVGTPAIGVAGPGGGVSSARGFQWRT